jgi:hypothetical protein
MRIHKDGKISKSIAYSEGIGARVEVSYDDRGEPIVLVSVISVNEEVSQKTSQGHASGESST